MSIINRTMYPVQTSMGLIGKMQDRFATLQVQLATGQKASNLAEMGSDRYFDLSIRNRMSRIEGYQNNIDMVNMRLGLMGNVVSRLDKIEGEVRGGMQTGVYGTSNINFGTVPSVAKFRLDEVLTVLNTDADGRYLFAGKNADTKPVEKMSTILDGGNGKAGFTQVAAERRAADVGNGLGRLLNSVSGAVASLAEDADHSFGFKLSTATASNLLSVMPVITAGPPDALAVTFAAQPAPDDTVSIGLTLPDGTASTVTLKATNSATPAAGEFQIGANEALTAANFSAALGSALTALAQTELVAASNFAAGGNFFNENGDPVLRVTGPDFANATVLAPADPTTTVQWYKGSSQVDPRSSVSAKIDDSATVQYGVQANESGLASLVRTLAVQSIQSFSNSDPTSAGRFDGIASRSTTILAESRNNEPGSIEMIGVELGTALATTDRVARSHTQYSAQLKDMLSDIESVSKEAVAMELLALQTRLQASYQATSLVAQLSLVNYL